MIKRLCKLNRKDISEELGEVYSLVTDAKYLCRSCARSSHDSAHLCKPTAIPPTSCLTKSVEEKRQCAVLTDTLSVPTIVSESKDGATKKALKKAKRQAKKQAKIVKKMAKVVEKQNKLIKKQKKIERQFLKFDVRYSHDQPSLH